MLSVILLFLAIIAIAMTFLSWEVKAKGWWVWAVFAVILSFLYISGINS